MHRSLFEATGGMDGLRRLAGAWHARVMADDVVSHAFGGGFHPQHTERLAAYWAEALGGPAAYSDAHGDETSVVRMHSGNGLHAEMDRRAIACFDEALADVGLADDDRLRRALHDYFAWATTTSMSRYHRSADDVPAGLRIPRWSWDGLVEGTETGRTIPAQAGVAGDEAPATRPRATSPRQFLRADQITSGGDERAAGCGGSRWAGSSR
jgi:hemoglobin